MTTGKDPSATCRSVISRAKPCALASLGAVVAISNLRSGGWKPAARRTSHPPDSCQRGRTDVSMRQVHRAEEKRFVDYAVRRCRWSRPARERLREAQIFVRVAALVRAGARPVLQDWV